MAFYDNMTTAEKVVLVVLGLVLSYTIYNKLSSSEQVLVRCPYLPIQHTQAQQMQVPERMQMQEQHTNLNTEDSNKLMVMFHAPWCGHCKNMMPIWDEFAQNLDGYNGVRVVKVDGQENPELAKLHGVQGFPTVKFLPKGIENTESATYNGARTVDSLSKFIQQL